MKTRYRWRRLKKSHKEVDRDYLDPHYPIQLTSKRYHPMYKQGKVYWLVDILNIKLTHKHLTCYNNIY